MAAQQAAPLLNPIEAGETALPSLGCAALLFELEKRGGGHQARKEQDP